MAIKNLLIAYNGGEASDSALHLAVQMANKYDAHLTGIVAHGASSVTRNIPSWLSDKMRSSITEITAQRITDLATKFQKRTQGKLPEDRIHWIDVKANPDQAVLHYSRLYDITVLGQYENLIASDELEIHPDRIAYECGRPVLVAPKNYQLPKINEQAIVAWDGKRTASRAMFDAMQVLETKDAVQIVSVGKPKDFPQNSSNDLITAMARHGIEASYEVIPATGTVAETLLTYCKQSNAGLLVMGAYRNLKVSDDIFGGSTSSLLRQTQIPLFLSH